MGGGGFASLGDTVHSSSAVLPTRKSDVSGSFHGHFIYLISAGLRQATLSGSEAHGQATNFHAYD